MRKLLLMLTSAVLLTACDDKRVYEEYKDFDKRYWIINDKPVFEFVVQDTRQPYNLYCNVRNSNAYPYSRLFVTYYLQDSTGREIQKNLFNEYLFDAKTGKPFGRSGLGDLYDQRFLILKDHRFDKPGKYKIQLEQFMRTDTLQGIVAVGLRVEKAGNL